jgi:hypothetical protein
VIEEGQFENGDIRYGRKIYYTGNYEIGYFIDGLRHRVVNYYDFDG